MPYHFRQRLPFNQQLYLAGVEDFADQQSFRDAYQGLTVGSQDVFGFQISGIYEPLNFLVDFDGGVLAEIP